MGCVNCNYLPCVGSGIIVSAVHFWQVSCVVKEVAKLQVKVLPATLLMSFECSPLLSPLLERFDYPIRKSGIIGRITSWKLFKMQAGYSVVTLI